MARSASELIVNSNEFRKIINEKFDLKAKCIYNPLDKKEIIKLSKIKLKFNFFNKNYLNIVNIGRLENQKRSKNTS